MRALDYEREPVSRKINRTVAQAFHTFGTIEPLTSFVWPDVGEQAFLSSLAFHCGRYVEAEASCVPPTEVEIQAVVDVIADIYTARIPKFNRAWFNTVLIKDVEPSSSTGLPWKHHYPKCSSFVSDGVIKPPSDELFSAVSHRLCSLVGEVVSDPINCFIKQEPHTLRKMARKSWRIISGVGLTDNIVDRLLFGDFCDSVVSKAAELDGPVAAGFNIYQGGFLKLASKLSNPETSDKSSWDWTMQPWLVDMFKALFAKIYGDHPYMPIVNNRLDALFKEAELRFRDISVKQNVAGIMKSGFLGTIVFNSVAQLALHLVARLRSGKTLSCDGFYSVGDDVIQECENEAYWMELERLGCIVKERKTGYPADFVGVIFGNGIGVPMYPEKNLYNLLFAEPEFLPDTLDSYQRLYALSPLFAPLNALAKQEGCALEAAAAIEWVTGVCA